MTSIIHSRSFIEKRGLEKSTKTCIECKIEKDKSAFTNDKVRADGKAPICKECKSKINRGLYKKNPNGFYKSVQKWIKSNPEKNRAHRVVNRAVANGTLEKSKTCRNCGVSGERLDAHHWHGYSEEHVRDVIWLCRPCHKKADRL